MAAYRFAPSRYDDGLRAAIGFASILLLGGCGGQLEGGRHLKYEGDPLMPNLLVTLTEKLGVPVERLGKSDGTLSVEPLSGV